MQEYNRVVGPTASSVQQYRKRAKLIPITRATHKLKAAKLTLVPPLERHRHRWGFTLPSPFLLVALAAFIGGIVVSVR